MTLDTITEITNQPGTEPASITQIEQRFIDAIQSAGLTPPTEVIADGALHRFASDGRRKDDAGWYVLHADGIAAGGFGCWRSGLHQTWCSVDKDRLTPSQRKAHQTRMGEIEATRRAEVARTQAAAARQAAQRWEGATPADDGHPYLTEKGVQAHGAGVTSNTLMIPIRDVDGVLHSLQFIRSGGEKRYLTGGRKKGCFFTMPGAGVFIVCEGFATGASIHEATDQTVIIAFDSGNLLAVAQALRQRHPHVQMLIAADDDWRTEGNPGVTAAATAAAAVGASVIKPTFGAGRPDKATDFNDMHQLAGLDAVRACFAGAIESASSNDHPTGAEGESGSESTAADTTGDPFPGLDERPKYVVLDDWAGRHRAGVYYCGIKEGKGEAPPTVFDTWICTPVHVDAITLDRQNNNFGRLLRFKPTVGRWREWAMPMEMLAGDGNAMRAELLAMGVEMDPRHSRNYLPSYLQSQHPKRRITCALHVGWHDETTFVLPDEVIGPKPDAVIFQSGERGHAEHTRGGTLAGWQSEVAAKAMGNPILMLAISCAFAGPLLARCHGEGGGVHLVGNSSTGKSSAVDAACSVWGGEGFKRSWRTTANGLEGAAAMFNDCLLALDEISECDSREVGAIVYALGNGTGKQRAGRNGSARAVTRWRCIILSNGEHGISTKMAESGQRIKAGQTVRLLDLPMQQAFGAWDNLHGAASPAAFADELKRGAHRHHGHAGRAFLERLTRDTVDYCAELDRIKASPFFASDGTDGQPKRAAARLAIIGLAGEVATEYGLTGWAPGAAVKAAAHAFDLWSGARDGRGNGERGQIAESVLAFIHRHGDARFSEADGTSAPIVRDRAGWWQDDGGRTYLFTADGMREALKGFDFKRSLDVLQQIGALPAPGADGKRTKPYRIGGDVTRLYPLRPANLEIGNHGA